MLLLSLGAMIALSLFYFSELGPLGLAKYWGAYIAIALASFFVFHAPFLGSFCMWLVVMAAVLRARSSDSLR